MPALLAVRPPPPWVPAGTNASHLPPSIRGCPTMLTIFGKSTRMCDGVTRRSFLKIGAFTFGAQCLSLADIFRSEARASTQPSPLGGEGRVRGHKALINIFLGGGPPHQDMWDIKTEAPKDIRGEFSPIATKVPGI